MVSDTPYGRLTNSEKELLYEIAVDESMENARAHLAALILMTKTSTDLSMIAASRKMIEEIKDEKSKIYRLYGGDTSKDRRMIRPSGIFRIPPVMVEIYGGSSRDMVTPNSNGVHIDINTINKNIGTWLLPKINERIQSSNSPDKDIAELMYDLRMEDISREKWIKRYLDVLSYTKEIFIKELANKSKEEEDIELEGK